MTTSAPLYGKRQNDARVCNPNPENKEDSSYTGSRIDRQVIFDHQKISAIQLHLSLCNNGSLVSRYIKDESLGLAKKTTDPFTNHFDDVIPWNQTLCSDATKSGTISCFKLARRKRFALRPISIFNPGDFVGGLFELAQEAGLQSDDSIDANFVPVGRLVADSIHNQWLEVHGDSKMKVYHIPLLYTPNVNDESDSSADHNDQWFKFISANELYKFSPETKDMAKKRFELSLNQVRKVVKKVNKKLKRLNVQASASKPVRTSIKSMIGFLSMIFKKRIDDLSKFKFNIQEIDFDTMMGLSRILSRDQYRKFQENLESIYAKLDVREQVFTYPRMKSSITGTA